MQPTPTIIHEDDSLLVINKPYGMVVNKSDTTGGVYTLQDWAEEYLKVEKVGKVGKVENNADSTSSTLSTFIERAGIVHRLDKETSGILLIAKTLGAFVNLQQQFKERVVKKTYIALAHGKVIPEEGEISAPVGRLPWNRMRFGVIAGGRESLTLYKVLSVISSGTRNPMGSLTGAGDDKVFSLVELYPQTGRTHQIRVHLKHINHPIFADFLYAGRKTSRDDRKILERVFLHATKIAFKHPSTGEEVTFESSLPEELQQTLEQMNDQK